MDFGFFFFFGRPKSAIVVYRLLQVGFEFKTWLLNTNLGIKRSISQQLNHIKKEKKKEKKKKKQQQQQQ